MTTTTWTNALLDNDGNNAGNWDNGLPDATVDAVLIDSTSSDAMTLSDALDCKTLTCTGYTGTISGPFDLTVSGNVTLGAGMTFSNEQLRIDANATLTSNGVPIVGLKVLGAHTLTLGDDADISTVEDLFDTLVGSTLAFGANDLILRNSGLMLSFVGLAVTFSAGAHILLQGNEWTSDAVATWPPLVDAAESGPGNLYDWKFDSITLAKSASFNGDLVVVGDMTIDAAPSIIFAYGSVVTVGGNFSADTTELASNGQAGTRPTIDVTGTAVAIDTFIEFLDFSGGTELDATDGCTSGGGTAGVDFGAPPNEAPVVDAGEDQTITALPRSTTLDGSATDDGNPLDPGAVSFSWAKVSGPGTVTFDDASDPQTDVGFSVDGVYVLRLTADDGELTDTDDVTITVDLVAPVIVGVTTDHGDGTFAADEVIDITVEFDEVVEVTGTPQLPLHTSSGTIYADYDSGDGSTELVFSYTALATDAFNALRIDGAAILLNGGTIKDTAGHNADLTLPQLGDAGALDADVAVSNATVYQTQLFTLPIGIV